MNPNTNVKTYAIPKPYFSLFEVRSFRSPFILPLFSAFPINFPFVHFPSPAPLPVYSVGYAKHIALYSMHCVSAFLCVNLTTGTTFYPPKDLSYISRVTRHLLPETVDLNERRFLARTLYEKDCYCSLDVILCLIALVNSWWWWWWWCPYCKLISDEYNIKEEFDLLDIITTHSTDVFG